MRRRPLLLAAAATPAVLAGCAAELMSPFKDLPSTLRLLQSLPASARMAEGWPLGQVLVHLAQSVEYSMSGFPEPKPALFRATAGPLAFAVFSARGRMSHGLSEPIPGAPAIEAATPVAEGAARLVTALSRFDGHGGVLMPHFAYGALDKGLYLRAHLMHLADHWQHFRTA